MPHMNSLYGWLADLPVPPINKMPMTLNDIISKSAKVGLYFPVENFHAVCLEWHKEPNRLWQNQSDLEDHIRWHFLYTDRWVDAEGNTQLIPRTDNELELRRRYWAWQNGNGSWGTDILSDINKYVLNEIKFHTTVVDVGKKIVTDYNITIE